MPGAYVMFGGNGKDSYTLAPETAEKAKETIVQAIKDGLPREARRMDVLSYLLDETKRWLETQRLDL